MGRVTMKRPVRQSLSNKNLNIIGIPKKFYDISIDDFKADEEELVKVRDYVADYIANIDDKYMKNSGIYFYGSNGVGKTMLSCIIAKEAYRHRYTSKRVTLSEYVQKYTAMWGAKDPEEKVALEEEFYNRFKAVDFLVLEEIGKELDTKVVRPILEDLLRYREDNGMVTIFCTNLSPVKVKEIYGASIFSLIKGNSYPVLIDERDRRDEYFEG